MKTLCYWKERSSSFLSFKRTRIDFGAGKPKLRWLKVRRYCDKLRAFWKISPSRYIYIAKSLYLGVLTFTGKYGKNGLPFLHTCLKIVDGFISYELFVKLTDKHLYIRLDSCHPAYSEYNIQSGLSNFSFKCFFLQRNGIWIWRI